MNHYSSKLFGIMKEGGLNLSVYKEYDLTTEGIRQTQLDISEWNLARSGGSRLTEHLFGRSESQDDGQASGQGGLNCDDRK